jgi:hypothetical protein
MVVSSASIVETLKPSNIAAATTQGSYEFLYNLHNFLRCGGAGLRSLRRALVAAADDIITDH